MDPNYVADCFHISGPAQFIATAAGDASQKLPIDWENEEHRRCIAACLANSTYVLENDRSTGRARRLAPAWWESFHFRLRTELIEDEGLHKHHPVASFGAIFELPDEYRLIHPRAPRYVVAFRGTIPDHWQDLLHDVFVVTNYLDHSSRYRRAYREVADLLADSVTGINADVFVWITGHSLGASMALSLGRDIMAEKGLSLPAFLFNPPQVSLQAAIRLLSMRTAAPTHSRHLLGCMVKAIVGSALLPSDCRERRVCRFEKLSPWVPELYVNEHDPICNGFIKIFEGRHTVEEDRPDLARSTEALSVRDIMAFAVFGKETEQPHLLPSARLWRSRSEESSALMAHQIQQWWKLDQELITRSYSYPLTVSDIASAAAMSHLPNDS